MEKNYVHGNKNERRAVFYTTHCPKCNILKEKMDSKHFAYETVDDVNLMLQKGIMEAPLLVVDGDPLSFSLAVAYINALEDE